MWQWFTYEYADDGEGGHSTGTTAAVGGEGGGGGGDSSSSTDSGIGVGPTYDKLDPTVTAAILTQVCCLYLPQRDGWESTRMSAEYCCCE